MTSDVGTVIAVIAFVVVVGGIAVVGVAIGMLVAPRLSRLDEPGDEDPGGDD